MQIVIATHNTHKVREFRTMLKQIPFLDFYSLNDYPDYHLPEETGHTFEENALLKATDAAQHLKQWVIADDSGLVVPSLQGSPGVFSARYAGNEATDADNRKKLLSQLKGKEGLERAAYFECYIVIAHPSGFKKCVHGTCEGFIATEEKGGNGFGYDSLFIKNDYNMTFAEMGEETKNRISHRRKAVDKLILILESLPNV